MLASRIILASRTCCSAPFQGQKRHFGSFMELLRALPLGADTIIWGIPDGGGFRIAPIGPCCNQ